MLPIVCSVVFCKLVIFSEEKNPPISERISPFFHIFVVLFLSLVIITGIPFSSRDFYKSRKQNLTDYHLAEVLQKNTSFESVCFSFSHEIPINPPQELAISKKRVHKIEGSDELDSKFPKLPTKAKKILVIDKHGSENLSGEQKNEETQLRNSNTILYEDEKVCLVEIKVEK